MGTLTQLLKKIKKSSKDVPIKTTLALTPYQPPLPKTDKDRFTGLYEQTDACWNWVGALDRYGYGRFQIGQKRIKAHRYSYEQHYGTFDKKLHVLHRCDNPRCVNPDHLFLGTNMDNVADRTTKKRDGDTSRRLTTKEKSQILVALQDGQSTKSLAEEFAVHISTIKRLKQTACKPI